MRFLKKHFGKGTPPERVEMEEERLGPCVFEREAGEDVLRLISPSLSFGRHEGTEVEIEVPGEQTGEALRCLAGVHDRQETYLRKFYEGILSFCEEWEETDSEGNPVTMELVERNSSLFRVRVKESWTGNLTVSLNGMIFDDRQKDLLGCHSVVMEIDGETGEVEYDLEG
ncbi:MAG: hypothetical protein HFI64_04735 [Lachnospiraceae bacterium]|nr:hypothetical protein [Lachnospiraceae bacterium]